MRTMKVLLPAIIIGTALACTTRKNGAAGGTNEAATPAVELLRATGRDWTAGIQGGGSGTEFTFTVVVHAQEPVIFTQVHMNGADHAPALVRPGSPVTQSAVVPAPGDTLDLRLSLSRTTPTGSPAAVIRYTLDGTAATLPVPAIERLPPLNRP